MATSASRRERLIAGGLGLRLASAAVGMPIIIAAILVGGPLFAALIALSLAIALGEIAVIVKLDLRSPLFIVGVAAVGAIIGVIASDANIPLLWPILASALGITGAATLSAIRSVPDPEPAQLKPILIGGLAMLAATA